LKKILFISSEFPPGPGGIGNHGFNLINTLQKKGFDTYTVTNLENATSKEAQTFSKSKNLRVVYIKRTPFIQFARFFYALKALLTFKPDIIICSGMFSLWVGRFLQFFNNKKCIAVIHGSEVDRKVNWQRKLTNWSLKGFKTIVSVSKYTQSLIPERYHDQLHMIIPNAVDIEFLNEFKNIQFKKLSGNPAILTVGNVTLRKGQHNLIKALPEILKKFPQAHYHCVGLKTLAIENEKLAKDFGVYNHVTFHGKLSLKELMGAYRGCDIFAMTSEHRPDGDFEGFGIAILEANYFGKPAIGSLGCGIEDAIDEDITGYKIDPHNPEQIANSIKKIIDSYDRLGLASKDWANAHNWDIIADSYIQLF
jgi:phosphatidylinositol alpha-1,6-mannosyltransferase